MLLFLLGTLLEVEFLGQMETEFWMYGHAKLFGLLNAIISSK